MVREKAFYRSLLLLSLPIAAQNILTYLVGLADNIMIARLGEDAVSGVYDANQIMTLLQMFVTGVCAALTVLAAQYWGKQDVKSVRSITGLAFRFASLAGILLYPRFVIGILTSDANAAAAGAEYARIVAFSFVPFCMSSVLIASLRCVETVRIGTVCALVSLPVNVFLNWVWIFGYLGAPAMGLRGAAYATLTARMCSLCLVVAFLILRDRKLRLTLRDLFTFRSPFTRDFLRYGLPVIAGDLLWGVNMATQGGIVGRLGTTSIAAVSIANTVFTIVSVGLYGTRDATSVLIGKAVGAGNVPRVKAYTKTLQVIYVLLGVVTGMVIFASQSVIPLFYRGITPETVQLSQKLLRVLSVTVIGTAYQMSALTGIVRAGGATRFVLVNDMIFVWLIVIPSAMLAAFVFHAPTPVVFACLKCDQILKCAVAAVKVNRYDWIQNLTKEPSEEQR